MREVTGDLWTFGPCDARVITTNGVVKKDGTCVMGRGCAKQAKVKYPGIDRILGKKILAGGNVVHILRAGGAGEILLSFPVKHRWFEEADKDLIRESAYQLMMLTEEWRWTDVVVPRPGCGNGRLFWLTDVKPILKPIFDDRIVIINNGGATDRVIFPHREED